MAFGLFGREAELRTVAAFLDGIESAPASLVIAGEAGMGKTALLKAGVGLAAERGYAVLQTMAARADMQLAFAGLADLLESHLPEVIDGLPAPQARALRVALLLEEAPAYSPDPHAIAAGFRAAVTALARTSPVLLVIDDVQWLDPASEAAVGYAIRRSDREPVGLLCAERAEGPQSGLPLELDHAQLPANLLPVGGLSIGALHRMLRAVLGTSFSHQTLRRIAAQSG